jgi:hypothetical protein
MGLVSVVSLVLFAGRDYVLAVFELKMVLEIMLLPLILTTILARYSLV